MVKTQIISLFCVLYSALVSSQCVNYGDGKSNCPESVPCCYLGYCNSSANFCILGNCQPDDSYSPSSCWPKPMCKDTNTGFSNPNILVTAADFTGDVNSQIFYSQEVPNYARVSGGNLVLGLKPQSDLTLTGQGSTVYFS
ncbi:putative glycosidase crf2, partial [Smittium mucronatum]